MPLTNCSAATEALEANTADVNVLEALSSIEYGARSSFVGQLGLDSCLALRAASKLGQSIVDPCFTVHPLRLVSKRFDGAQEWRSQLTAMLKAMSLWPRCGSVVIAAELQPDHRCKCFYGLPFRESELVLPHIHDLELHVGFGTEVAGRPGPHGHVPCGPERSEAVGCEEHAVALTYQLAADIARTFPMIKALALSDFWCLAPAHCRAGFCSQSTTILSIPAPPGGDAGRLNTDASTSSAGRTPAGHSAFAALGPAHLPHLRSLSVPTNLTAAPGLGVLTRLEQLTLQVAPPLHINVPHHHHLNHQAAQPDDNDDHLQQDHFNGPLPPDLHRLQLLSSLTLEGGASDPADWLPHLAALPRLSRLRLRSHTASLPGSRSLFGLSVLEDLDLDLERRTLILDGTLDVHQLVCCVRLCERVLTDRIVGASEQQAALPSDRATADCVVRADPLTETAAALAAAAPGLGFGSTGCSGGASGGGALASVSLTRLDVGPSRYLDEDLAFLEHRFAAGQQLVTPAGASVDEAVAAPPPHQRGALSVWELKVSWFETAASLHRVLALAAGGGGDRGGAQESERNGDGSSNGEGKRDGSDGGSGVDERGSGGSGVLRTLELWCSGDSEALLRRLLCDLTRGALPPGVALPPSVVLVTRQGLDAGAMTRVLRHCPELLGVLTARRAGGGGGGL